MAHGQQGNGHIEAIGAVERKAAAAPAAHVQAQQGPAGAHQAAEPARNAQAAESGKEGQEARGREQGQLAPNAPDDLDLSPAAREEQEQRRQEAEEKRQAEIEALMAEIEQLKAQIEQAHQQKDERKAEQLGDRLQGLETQLGGLIDGVQGGGAARGAGAAGQGGAGMPDLIPRPPMAGGMPGMNAGGGRGGFNPMGGGVGGFNPMLQGQGGGRGLAAGNHAPAANPNVEIPSFGPKANKAQVGQMLEAASQKYGIPANILKAVAWQESGWNQNALSFDGHHGKGIMQIDDRFHAFARTQDVFDPAKNIDYGARYLKEQFEKTGSWAGALKRYNGGSAYPPKVLALAEQQPWQKYA